MNAYRGGDNQQLYDTLKRLGSRVFIIRLINTYLFLNTLQNKAIIIIMRQPPESSKKVSQNLYHYTYMSTFSIFSQHRFLKR